MSFIFSAMLFQLSEKLYMQTDVLIYLPSHNFLYKFGDVVEVGYWSIILESVSVKTGFS